MSLCSRGLLAALLICCATATAQTTTLCTTFAGGNGQDGNMFDVSSTIPVTITGFDQVFGGAGATTVEIYITIGGGSYVGNESNAAAWTLLETVSLTASGAGIADPLPLSPAFMISLAPGQTQGIYITTTGSGPNVDYTNGTTVGAPFASDTALTFFEGIGNAYPFGGTFSPRVWNGCIKYQPASTFADDLTVQSIDAPMSSDPASCMPALSNTEVVSVTILNLGTNPVPAGTQIPLTWQVDGGLQTATEATPPLAAALPQFGTLTYTFTATADLSIPATYTIDVIVSLPGDANPANDLVSTMIDSVSAPVGGGPLPFFEDFETSASNGTQIPPAGWVQDTLDGTSDWFFRNTGPGSGNGPTNDHTTGSGFFAHTEDSTNEGSNAAINLDTPCLDLTTATNPILTFWVNSNDSPNDQNPLAVDVVAIGATVQDILTPIGSTNDEWVQFSASLQAFIGTTVRVRFRGRNDNPNQTGNGFSNDVGLDDVSLVDVIPGNGQAPQDGIAVLDIANSTEVNGFGVSSLLNGPYSASVAAGDNFDLVMGGEMNQAVLFLVGDLAVGAINAGPPFGQLDLANVVLAADGNGSGFLDSLFVLDGSGNRAHSFPSTSILSGQTLGFQLIVFNTGTAFGFSNAVEVTFN